MAYLFDTDAISEVLRSRPAPRYVEWLRHVPREEQFTSAVTIGELYKGAFRSRDEQRHLANIEERVLEAVSVLPCDVAVAREYGRVRAYLEERAALLPDADLQIAATAIYHGLELVTGNLSHFARLPDLTVNPILAECRRLR